MISKEEVKTILVADDSGMARTIIKQCFEIAGFRGRRFIEAVNGKDAYDKLMAEKTDIIVTDLNMPVMDGTTLLTNLKALAEFQEIPIIVITSTSNAAKAEELKKAGAFAIINKPISPASVNAACTALGKKQ